MKKIPVNCPCCDARLKVSKLVCDFCDTEIGGKFTLPLLMQLTIDEQEFVLNFLKYSGSLKEMANQMGKSYPTVRNILDDLIRKLNSLANTSNVGQIV